MLGLADMDTVVVGHALQIPDAQLARQSAGKGAASMCAGAERARGVEASVEVRLPDRHAIRLAANMAKARPSFPMRTR